MELHPINVAIALEFAHLVVTDRAEARRFIRRLYAEALAEAREMGRADLEPGIAALCEPLLSTLAVSNDR